MIPETDNPQEGKRVSPGWPARHAEANPGRYFSQSTILVFWWNGSFIFLKKKIPAITLFRKNKYADKHKSLSYQ